MYEENIGAKKFSPKKAVKSSSKKLRSSASKAAKKTSSSIRDQQKRVSDARTKARSSASDAFRRRSRSFTASRSERQRLKDEARQRKQARKSTTLGTLSPSAKDAKQARRDARDIARADKREASRASRLRQFEDNERRIREEQRARDLQRGPESISKTQARRRAREAKAAARRENFRELEATRLTNQESKDLNRRNIRRLKDAGQISSREAGVRKQTARNISRANIQETRDRGLARRIAVRDSQRIDRDTERFLERGLERNLRDPLPSVSQRRARGAQPVYLSQSASSAAYAPPRYRSQPYTPPSFANTGQSPFARNTTLDSLRYADTPTHIDPVRRDVVSSIPPRDIERIYRDNIYGDQVRKVSMTQPPIRTPGEAELRADRPVIATQADVERRQRENELLTRGYTMKEIDEFENLSNRTGNAALNYGVVTDSGLQAAGEEWDKQRDNYRRMLASDPRVIESTRARNDYQKLWDSERRAAAQMIALPPSSIKRISREDYASQAKKRYDGYRLNGWGREEARRMAYLPQEKLREYQTLRFQLREAARTRGDTAYINARDRMNFWLSAERLPSWSVISQIYMPKYQPRLLGLDMSNPHEVMVSAQGDVTSKESFKNTFSALGIIFSSTESIPATFDEISRMFIYYIKAVRDYGSIENVPQRIRTITFYPKGSVDGIFCGEVLYQMPYSVKRRLIKIVRNMTVAESISDVLREYIVSWMVLIISMVYYDKKKFDHLNEMHKMTTNKFCDVLVQVVKNKKNKEKMFPKDIFERKYQKEIMNAGGKKMTLKEVMKKIFDNLYKDMSDLVRNEYGLLIEENLQKVVTSIDHVGVMLSDLVNQVYKGAPLWLRTYDEDYDYEDEEGLDFEDDNDDEEGEKEEKIGKPLDKNPYTWRFTNRFLDKVVGGKGFENSMIEIAQDMARMEREIRRKTRQGSLVRGVHSLFHWRRFLDSISVMRSSVALNWGIEHNLLYSFIASLRVYVRTWVKWRIHVSKLTGRRREFRVAVRQASANVSSILASIDVYGNISGSVQRGLIVRSWKDLSRLQMQTPEIEHTYQAAIVGLELDKRHQGLFQRTIFKNRFSHVPPKYR